MSQPPRSHQQPTIAVVQASCDRDRDANLTRGLSEIAEAARRGANIVCLQELFGDVYFCQTEDHARFEGAEALDGPTCRRLGEAAQMNGVVVVGSIFERRGPGMYHNTAVVFDVTGKRIGVYRKMHIPDDPGYYEKFYFRPGDLGFRVIPTRFGKLGVAVCWDQWFPETARLLALAGAEILFFPTAIGWLPDEKDSFGPAQYEAWQMVMRSHAVTNGVFVAAPNRVGREEGIEFWGGSFICDPYGRLLAQGGHDRDELVMAACNLDLIETARTHWPFLRDRRVDAYAGLLECWLETPESEAVHHDFD